MAEDLLLLFAGPEVNMRITFFLIYTVIVSLVETIGRKRRILQ
jgi:hypothetical protein